MKKTIFFILDSFNLYDFKKLYGNHKYISCYSYIDTEQAIENKITDIVTYDIGHLSFDLETLGYKIFIGYKVNINILLLGCQQQMVKNFDLPIILEDY